jgi:DNA repair protein RecO (recombination protein O)
MQEKDQAICLRAVNYSESSQIVTLLTREHGKIACMAKGSKRPKSAMDGAIEIFSFGPVIFSTPKEDGLTALSEFCQQLRFRQLRQNLFALNSGLLAAELIESLTEMSDPHPDLFDVFAHFLDAVGAQQNSSEQLWRLIAFEIILLRELGIAIITDRCANCAGTFSNKWKYAYFSSEAKGVICPGCENAYVDKFRLDIACAAALSHPANLNGLSDAALHSIHKAMLNHFAALLHRSPKTAAFF